MSHESQFITYDDDASSIEVITTTNTKERILETVESLRMWISSIEDKVFACTCEVESLHEALVSNDITLKAILGSLKELTAEVKTKERVKRMTECNRELGLALSAKIYKSEAKRLKTTYTPQNTFHPSVLPYIFSDEDSSDVDEKEEDENKAT